MQALRSCVCAAGSQFTGTAINPARALGPAIVFHCRWDQVWLYVIAGSLPAPVLAQHFTDRAAAELCQHSTMHMLRSCKLLRLEQPGMPYGQ